jgi:hypothetical protein
MSPPIWRNNGKPQQPYYSSDAASVYTQAMKAKGIYEFLDLHIERWSIYPVSILCIEVYLDVFRDDECELQATFTNSFPSDSMVGGDVLHGGGHGATKPVTGKTEADVQNTSGSTLQHAPADCRLNTFAGTFPL